MEERLLYLIPFAIAVVYFLMWPRRNRAEVFAAFHQTCFVFVLLAYSPLLTDDASILDLWRWALASVVAAALLTGIWRVVIFISLPQAETRAPVLRHFSKTGFLAILALSPVLVRQANIHLDPHPPQIKMEKISEKSCQLRCKRIAGRSSSYGPVYPMNEKQCSAALRNGEAMWRNCYQDGFEFYLVAVDSLTGKEARHPVWSEIFDQAEKGDYVSTPSHQGLLGIPWQDGNELNLVNKL